MKKTAGRLPAGLRRRNKVSLSTIALWQFIAFFVMLLLIWVNETLDLSSLFFGEASSRVDMFGACILTAFLIVVAIVSVGHTYTQAKHMLSGLITICSHCHRIRIDKDAWGELEQYLSDRSEAVFSHGLCPDCYKEEVVKVQNMPPPVASSGNSPDTELKSRDDWDEFTPPKEILPGINPPPEPEDRA